MSHDTTVMYLCILVLINLLHIQNTLSQTDVISSSESLSSSSQSPIDNTITSQTQSDIPQRQSITSSSNYELTSSSTSANGGGMTSSADNQIKPTETPLSLATSINNGGSGGEVTQTHSPSASLSESLSKTPASQSSMSHYVPSSDASSSPVSMTAQGNSPSITPTQSTKTMELSSTVYIMTTMKPTPKAAPKHCNDVEGSYCEHGGVCFNQTGIETKPVCSCTDDYYGEQCEKKIIPKLYMQLTYALGGTTGFLLLVVICFVCCRCQKRKTGKGELPFSEELDSFSVGSKRASAMFPSSSNGKNKADVMSFDNNGIDMYGD